MTIWSLAIITGCGPSQVDVALYLTNWQAYEALLRWMKDHLSDDEGPGLLSEAEHDELYAMLHRSGPDEEFIDRIETALALAEASSAVTRHDYPWALPRVSRGEDRAATAAAFEEEQAK